MIGHAERTARCHEPGEPPQLSTLTEVKQCERSPSRWPVRTLTDTWVPPITRQGFLGQSIKISMATAAASTLLEAYAARALAAQGRAIKFSHGTGLCNLPLFYAAEKNLFQKYAIEGIVVMTPMAGISAIQVATGQVEMGVIPYTNANAAYTRSPAFSVVSGSGIQGLIVVAKPAIKSFQELKGKKIGTFQADTLDIIVYDYLKKLGFTYQDVQMQYLGDSVELANALWTRCISTRLGSWARVVARSCNMRSSRRSFQTSSSSSA
jgi:NMT1/THI5 like